MTTNHLSPLLSSGSAYHTPGACFKPSPHQYPHDALHSKGSGLKVDPDSLLTHPSMRPSTQDRRMFLCTLKARRHPTHPHLPHLPRLPGQPARHPPPHAPQRAPRRPASQARHPFTPP
eukprot:31938-Chlamydomonas_euryale.AAC.3